MPRLICAITIDTEPDCTTKWTRSNPLKFDSVNIGIKSLLQPLFDKYDIKPVYFVSPEVLYDDKSIQVLLSIKTKCEIGNHLHSEYIEPEKEFEVFNGTNSKKFACFDYSNEVEFAKIENCDKLIQKKLGIKPTSFRAARFGADINTINSLSKLGYTVDSSVTPHIDWSKQGGPNFKDYSEQPYFIDLNNFQKENKESKILEVPITIGKKRLPILSDRGIFQKWLRPSFMMVWEMKKLINEYLKKYQNGKHVVFCLMFHSMEVIPKATPYTRSKLEVKLFISRLQKIIKYLHSLNCQFETLNRIYKIYQEKDEEF